MNRSRAWGLSAALASGLGLSALSAMEPPPNGAESRPWYARLFPAAAPASPTPKPTRPVITAPLAPETLAEALRAEQDAYLRRLDVCTKLRQVAIETNDEQLLAKADGLEQQATTLYHQRTARLGVRGGPKGSINTSTVASNTTSEETLSKTLGTSLTPLSKEQPAPQTQPAVVQARQWKVVPE